MTDQTQEIIDIPVTDDVELIAASQERDIEVEELTEAPGHFAVNYRRC